jgi:hypothetical protein
LAASIKWLFLGLTLPLQKRNTAAIALAVLALTFAPYLGAGPRILGSLGEYARRWRSNAGAFALIEALSRSAVDHTRFRERYEPSPAVARLVSGRDRDQVYPDEAAAFLARSISAALFFALLVWMFVRGFPPLRFSLLMLLGYCLLTPALHPWYALWLLPFASLDLPEAPAAALLVVLVPLGYAPLAGWWQSHDWNEPIWTRLLEHGTVWAALSWTWLTRPNVARISGTR